MARTNMLFDKRTLGAAFGGFLAAWMIPQRGWLAYFMGLVIFYALINWVPVLLKEAGLPAQTATLISALFPLGGVGAILFGWLMDRYNANRVIATGFALTAVAIFMIGQVVGNLGLLTVTVTVFVAGALMNTAQSSLPALAAAYYPTQAGATGVSWMLGVGRFGGIAGSFLVAELSRRQLEFRLASRYAGRAGLDDKQIAGPDLRAARKPRTSRVPSASNRSLRIGACESEPGNAVFALS
jgi:MFS family permease